MESDRRAAAFTGATKRPVGKAAVTGIRDRPCATLWCDVDGEALSRDKTRGHLDVLLRDPFVAREEVLRVVDAHDIEALARKVLHRGFGELFRIRALALAAVNKAGEHVFRLVESLVGVQGRVQARSRHELILYEDCKQSAQRG